MALKKKKGGKGMKVARVILTGEGKNITVRRILYVTDITAFEKAEKLPVVVKGVAERPRILTIYRRGNEVFLDLDEVLKGGNLA